jgi:hypothetical protein
MEKSSKKKILIPVEMFIRPQQQQHGTHTVSPRISSVFILFGEFFFLLPGWPRR